MLIVANWKAYVEDLARAKQLLATARRLARNSEHEIVLAPPAPFLGALARPSSASQEKQTSDVAFSAQDISQTTGGAATGEVTAQVFAAAGATYAIVGHSERRAAGDTDEMIAEKLSHALAHGLTPILCIGERERDDDGRYLGFLREEMTRALEGFEPKERAKVIIAYEPLWAIGRSAADAISPDDLVEMALYIRKILAELLPGKTASRTKVLYGGSVEPADVRNLAVQTGVDGFLIGHESADPKAFADIIKLLS